MQNLMLEAKACLEEEFGFSPEQSKVLTYTGQEWKSKFPNHDPRIDGIFRPRFLEAHVCSDPESTFLARWIHEFLGHGSYCEFTLNGWNFVEYEKELQRLEAMLVGDELPPDKIVRIEQGMGHFGLSESDDSRGDYVLRIDSDDPIFGRYLSLKKEYKDFFEDNRLTFEGFAVWLEEFLLKRLGLDSVWSERMGAMVGTEYEGFYQKTREFEQENSVLSLVYRAGFPRRFDSDSVVRFAGEHLDLGRIELLVLYGSRRRYGDVDLLAVSKIDRPREVVFTDEVDVVQVSEAELLERLELFDLKVTEPVLTGDVVFGDPERLTVLRDRLCTQDFSEKAGRYLRRRGLEAFNLAEYYFSLGIYHAVQGIVEQSGDPAIIEQAIRDEIELYDPNFLLCLDNLSAVWSYSIARELHEQGHSPVTLREILGLSSGSVLNQIKYYTTRIRNIAGSVPERGRTKRFLEETRRYFSL